MSDEYDDEFSAEEPHAAPSASTTSAPAAGLKAPRTIDRRVVPTLIALFCFGIGISFWLLNQSRQPPTRAAVAQTAPLTTEQPWLPPAASPTPVAELPSPMPSIPPRPAVQPQPYAQAPQGSGGGGGSVGSTTTAAQQTPSPEQQFMEEERRRVLEARRASTKIALDSDRDLAGQEASDQQSLQRGSQMSEPEGQSTSVNGPGIATGSPTFARQQYATNQQSAGYYVPNVSRYELRRGTRIPANWVTSLDSSLPGGVLVAQVSQDVMDSITHSVVVYPAGTILTGEGNANTSEGEARYQCYFDEVELPAPDRRKFFMGLNPGAGRLGENGADVSVDTHAGRDFGHAMEYALVQAGLNLANRASTSIAINGNTGSTFQQSHSAPTFHTRVGQPLTIIVSHDLAVDAFRDMSTMPQTAPY